MNKVSELSSTGELWFDVTIDTGASGNGSIDTAAVVAPRIRSKGVMYALASSRASTADQIRGTTVDSALAPTSGQVLTYDGTKWSSSTPVVSSATGFVAITGTTMSGTLTAPTINVNTATSSRIAIVDSSKNITSTTATVTQTELQYLSGVTAAIQTQINSFPDYSNGVTVSYNTVTQATANGYLLVIASGSYMNGLRVKVGPTNPPTPILAEFYDDINSNTKSLSTIIPVKKDHYFKVEPLGAHAYESISIWFYPLAM
jgi:hypothetical protein